jgi:hypothetical protein
MIATAPRIEDFTLNITEEIHVRAPLKTTFDALLEQLGPFNETGEHKPMPMKLEAWPGGRWYTAGGTLIVFHHTALGFIPEDYKAGMTEGWKHMNAGAKARAEAQRSK